MPNTQVTERYNQELPEEEELFLRMANSFSRENSAARSNLVAGDTDTEEGGKENHEDYTDYYKAMAESDKIRPISVSEGVDFTVLSRCEVVWWWSGTILKMLR